MSMRVHSLILVLPVLCWATEYYVRPTEPTNTSCPAQPCLSLNQYINDSCHYFKSNTVFKFLPGTHHMDQPLLIGNVRNLSLENFYSKRTEQPHLMAQISCGGTLSQYEGISVTERHECISVRFEVDDLHFVCCAAIQFYDSQNITLKGISITTEAADMSDITFQNVSVLKLHLVTACSATPYGKPMIWSLPQVGILISEASMVEVYSSDTANYSCGFAFQRTVSTFITNITAVYSNYYGIALCDADNTTMINPKATNNCVGMRLYYDINTTIVDAIVVHNGDIGMDVFHTFNANIINPTAMFNGKDGIFLMEPHKISIINATVMYNAYGGITMTYAKNVHIINTSVHVTQGSEVTIITGYISISSSSHTKIFNSSFTGIDAFPNAASSPDPTNHPAVIVLYDSSLYVSECNFTGNGISSVKAYASHITAAGDLIFSHNRAIAGTAFILVQNSILRLTRNSHVHFSDNHAINTGGVFYITKNVYYSALSYEYTQHGHPLLQSTCFLNIEGERSRVRLTFVNNSAGKGGDILYGGQVALGLVIHKPWNCLESFKEISNISQNGLSLITSDPSRVCLCNETGQPDCLTLVDPTPHSIYPGQSFNISAVVVGQQFGAVAGSVYAQFLQRSATVSSLQLDTWQGSQIVTQEKCNSLQFTIFSKNEESDAMLVLTATNKEITQFFTNADFTEFEIYNDVGYFYKTTVTDPMKYPNNPVYINISILSCPLGFMLTTESPFTCACNQLLQSIKRVRCHIQDQTISRSGLVWVGTLKNNSRTVVASEYCSFDYCNGGESYVTLSDPDSQCNYNHSGTLCGGCQPGLSLALGSTQCLPCSNKYLALLVPFALAGPAVVFFIKLLDITISHGTLNGLIFYANIVKANEHIFIPHGHTNPLMLFIAWLNLDLGVETCFFNGLTAYTKTWLQFVFPVYIWSIAGLIIVIAKHSDHVAKVMGNNSVPVLATLFLLSYAKLLRTIITALSYTMLYSSQGHKAVWSADGNVDYLGSKHAPLFAVAVAALLFLWLPYTLLLFVGQWLHRCNCRLIDHMLMKIKPFLDTHYGPLKDKHHYWFGTLLLVRAAILLISALIPGSHSGIIKFCVSVSAIVLMLLGMIVYRNIIVATFEVSIIMNLALLSVASMFTSMVSGDQTVAACTLTGITLAQFLGLVLFKVFSILKRSEKVMAFFHRRQPVEDDWELYEEAALQREMESDTEEEDSEGSESIVSLPTY